MDRRYFRGKLQEAIFHLQTAAQAKKLWALPKNRRNGLVNHHRTTAINALRAALWELQQDEKQHPKK